MSWLDGLLSATPIGQRMLAARQQQEMSYYRNLMAQRQQQEWDAQQQQLKAGKEAFASRGWSPANIPVTPQVGSPNYAQARMALDQADPQGKVQVGNIGEFTPQQAGLLEAMANTGQFNLAGQAAKDFMPQAPEWRGASMGGMPGQINTKTGKFDPFPQASQTQDDISIRELNVGDNIRYGRFNKQGQFLGYVQEPEGGLIGGPRASRDESGPAGPFAGVGIQAQAQNMLLTGDPNTPEYAAAYSIASSPQVTYDANGRPVTVTPDLSWARKPAAGGGSRIGTAAPGQPQVTVGEPIKPMDADRAVRIANMKQATRDAQAARDLFFPKGQFDRRLTAQASLRVPTSKGRDARQAIERAVEVLLRLRTGAAAPEQEVRKYTAMFSPSILDSEEGAKTKMDQLQAFFDDTMKLAGVSKDDLGGSEQGSDLSGLSDDAIIQELIKQGVPEDEILKALGQ